MISNPLYQGLMYTQGINLQFVWIIGLDYSLIVLEI